MTTDVRMSDMDWYDWHAGYADADSPLSRRLRLVQRHIASRLDERSDSSLSVVSLCAGQGRDLLEVLAARPDTARVRSHLVEYDPRPASRVDRTLPSSSDECMIAQVPRGNGRR